MGYMNRYNYLLNGDQPKLTYYGFETGSKFIQLGYYGNLNNASSYWRISEDEERKEWILDMDEQGWYMIEVNLNSNYSRTQVHLEDKYSHENFFKVWKAM